LFLRTPVCLEEPVALESIKSETAGGGEEENQSPRKNANCTNPFPELEKISPEEHGYGAVSAFFASEPHRKKKPTGTSPFMMMRFL
jgi:hypothetical protein